MLFQGPVLLMYFTALVHGQALAQSVCRVISASVLHDVYLHACSTLSCKLSTMHNGVGRYCLTNRSVRACRPGEHLG